MSYSHRPATTEEIAAKYVGRKMQFLHATVEGARRHRGAYITVHKNKTTALIQQDEDGIFAMRKGQRENLKADFYTLDNGSTFVAGIRAVYL